MNKYLMKRIEEAHLSPVIDNLVFVTAEAMRGEDLSQAFEDFTNNDTDDIIKSLGWKDSEDVRKLIESEIEDKSLAYTMTKYGRDGFLAEVLFDEPRGMRFNEKGEPSSWAAGGVYWNYWIYADSIGELIEKIIEKDEELFKQAIEEAKTPKQEEKE